jgi:very-short-patch-repair endonuclease
MPSRRTTPKGYEIARQLRHETTPTENKLWAYLRLMRVDGVRFRRQHAIGPFIADFCAPKEKMIIELDGSQHIDQEDYDDERSEYLTSIGYKVIRFWNNDVMNHIEDVMQSIQRALDDGKDEAKLLGPLEK